MTTYRTAAATAALALFMIAAAPVPQMFGPVPAAAQTADQLLADQTPLKSMDKKALRERVKALKEQVDSGNLSKDQKRAVRDALKQARAELQSRRDDSEATQTDQQAQQTQQVQSMSPDLAAAMNDTRPASTLSRKELRSRIRTGMEAIKSGNLSNDQKRAMKDRVAEARTELKKRKDDSQTTQQQTETPVKSKDTQVTVPKVEASQVMADKRPASSLSDRDLRDRLNQTRAVLREKNADPATMKALRAQLAGDRQELRSRVADKSDTQESKAKVDATTENNTAVDIRTTLNNSDNNVIDNSTTIINNTTTVTQVIQRQTSSDKLSQRDLNRRIRLLEKAKRENRLQGHDLVIAGQLIIDDRRVLRVRLLNDRDRRRKYFQQHRGSFNLGINVGIAPRFDIVAAEADYTQIEDQLIAAPRFRPQRRYTVDEIARDDQVRRAMPGIEIDTVTFEFGSAELAPEMVDELENVATVIEKVTAVRPDEIFLIEGHTDAVGPDDANQRLSQARAETVKAALADYFAIDPASLRTVGLGERFLKIPTEEPEQENRRVTVRRITPLLTGQVQ